MGDGFSSQTVTEQKYMTFDPFNRQQRDPDAALVAVFKSHSIPNEAKTAAAGRPIEDDIEICEIRFPGSRAVSVFPATAVSHWVTDPYTGHQTQQTYAERFSHQYRQFKAQTVQTKQGTPLEYVPFLTAGRRAELKAQNLYTIEALAEIDGEPLKNLGVGARELKNQAMEFIAGAQRLAPSTQLQAKLEAVEARAAALEQDNQALAAKLALEACGDAMLDAMSDTQLKDYVAANTGTRPLGNPARKTLLRMAIECKPKVS
jgi:hypothetical protein